MSDVGIVKRGVLLDFIGRCESLKTFMKTLITVSNVDADVPDP